MSGYRQITSWGHIDWLRARATDSSARADVGIVCLLPGKQQAEHTHYSETQFLYMLEGFGEHIIDGVRSEFHPGDHFFLPCGIRHSTTNLGDTPVKELLVSLPVHLSYAHERPAGQTLSEAAWDEPFIRQTLLDGIRQLASDTLDHLNVPLVISEENGSTVYENCRSELCEGCAARLCPLRTGLRELNLPNHKDSVSIVCPKGLTVLIQPIEAEGIIRFYLKSGLFHEYSNAPISEGVYDVPGSTVTSIRILLQEIARYLLDYYESARLERELTRREDAAAAQQNTSRAIAEAFERTRENALNIQIRNHFLFNTLNTIASLAIRDNSMDAYTAILDLSELLRGLLRKEGSRVPLSEELIFLQRYLSLQELRHEDNLEVVWSRSSAAERVIVPHNFLQPIAENAFVHGFHDLVGVKQLRISTALEGNRTVITVRDNCCGMSREQLATLNASLSSDSLHGLSMVSRKLTGVFGMDFTITLESEPGKGTTCRISLPC